MSKNFLQEHFVRGAMHHARLGKQHHDIRDSAKTLRSALGKATKSDLKDLDVAALEQFLEDFIEHHSAIGDEAMSFSSDLAETATKCDKADLSGDLNKLAPIPGISGVAPSAPPAEAFGISAVVRPGSRPLDERPKVSTQFSKFVTVDE